MFSFVIKYLGGLKFIPGMGLVFDGLLKLQSFITDASVLDHIDYIAAEASVWPGVTITNHKYGGIQFNAGNREVGHIHSNGLLDMLLSRRVKAELMISGRVQDHHTFKNTGWISFYIKTNRDKTYALELLRLAYDRLTAV